MSEPALTTKSLTLKAAEFKAGADGWSFEGYASTFGDPPDSYGDVIKSGAFADSLADNPAPPLLWSHSMGHPIGIPVELAENRKGLYGRWELVDTAAGSDAYKLLKKGAVKGLSIGFYALDADDDEDRGTRTLKEIELVEISLVAVPANRRAQVSGVKCRHAEHRQPAAVTIGGGFGSGTLTGTSVAGNPLPTLSLNTDLKFADLFDQLGPILETLAAEAESLRERRAQDERELSDGHVAALGKAIEEAEAFAGRLAALRPSPTKAEAAATEDLSARLDATRRLLANDLAERRRRYAAAGYLESPT